MWFEVDKEGLSAIVARRGKSFAIFELVSNAWDSGASEVRVTLEPVENVPYAQLSVEDNSEEGWDSLEHAYKVFSKSSRRGQAEKRGRFSLGEKLVLSLCKTAVLETMAGTIEFREDGRRMLPGRKRSAGTKFSGLVRMTRVELDLALDAAQGLIPKVPTFINGSLLGVPALIGAFAAKLPTEAVNEDGDLFRTTRMAQVEAFEAHDGGEILEMGVPVCSADWPWRLNVLQKVPLGFDRDSVSDAFRRALQVAATNALAHTIDSDQAAQPWAAEVIGDARIAPEALDKVIISRFGERAVVATPNDPMANAKAEALGCQVLHGGSLSASAWANLRKHQTIPTTAQAFPTPKPAADAPQIEYCPLCKQQMP